MKPDQSNDNVRGPLWDGVKAALMLSSLSLPIAAFTSTGRADETPSANSEFDISKQDLSDLQAPQGEEKEEARRIVAPREDLIDQAKLKEHVEYLASDERKGRDTGSPALEQEVTAYVEKLWKEYGLVPAGNKERTSYQQPFVARTWWWDKNIDDHLEIHHPHNRFGHTVNEGGLAFSPDGDLASIKDMQHSFQALGTSARQTHNLVGIIPGETDEYIVIGAHMDHIGEKRNPRQGEDAIFNGADDNATGSATVLELSRVISKAVEEGHKPKRGIVFMLFSGEELGLLGSQYYVKNPTVPLDKVSAMLNIDMLGRLDPKQISVFDAAKDGKKNLFHDMHDTTGTGFEHIDHNIEEFLERSDQYPFYENDIPVIFFFEGFTEGGEMNPDYHGLGDHANKIEYGKLKDSALFVYRHLWGAVEK